MVAWKLKAAKQRFSELVKRAQREGPQVVTKHSREAVVVISAEEYRLLTGADDNLIEFLRSAPDFDLLDLRRAVNDGGEPAR
jgi:antitoxin Phd